MANESKLQGRVVLVRKVDRGGRLPTRTKNEAGAKRVDYGELSERLGFLIRLAQLWVSKDIRRRLAPFEAGSAQYALLTVVNANPGINQLAVASALSIERSGLGRMVDRLEERNLLKRLSSTVDRRSYVLFLTAEGRKMLARMQALIDEHERDLAKKIGADRYASLLRVLTVFRD